MRKTFFTHLFIWCVVLGFVSTAVAQDHSAGRVPITNEKAAVNYTVTNQAPDLDGTAYGWGSIALQYLSMPIPAGDPWTLIAPMTAPGFLSSATFGPTGILYFTDTSTFELYTVNVATGALTLVGSTTVGLNGITYDWSTGTFWAVDATSLYTIDVGTGATTLVGPFGLGGGELMIDVAVSCAGEIYAYDLVSNGFFSINPATGAATLIGDIGFVANFGQGMNYDYSTGILYMSAFNSTTTTGQLRTVDVATGMTTLVFDWGFEQVAPFAIDQICGAPCPVGDPSGEMPINGTLGVDINLAEISWTNGSGATEIEVFFDGASVYVGVPITSWSIPGPLNYSTTYSWKVNGSDGACWTFGPSWSFTTADDPNIVQLFMDDFTAGLGMWTITNDGGTCVWDIFDASDYTLPPTAVGNNMAADADFCGSGTTILSTATLVTAVDATLYQTVWVEFDNDWQAIDVDDFAILDVSVDGGATWLNVFTWNDLDIRNTHENWDITAMAALSNVLLRFVSIQPGWDWWWAVDNVAIYGSDPIPVELTSFAANVSDGNVTLNWSTATELNNQGFNVERNSGDGFQKIGFVPGFGTSADIHNYSYVDGSVEEGTYTYRLKQVDYDGTFEYSDAVEVDVTVPDVFALEQNYPNPFNPSTTIRFSLAVDSKVSLTVFDVLGQEVAKLVNGNLAAGPQEMNFNAASVNSGVYFYRLDATGVDGTNFTSVKKMILTK
ncbi:T9SS type A sorting domain-containing protein [Bacteroidota bacterium]